MGKWGHSLSQWPMLALPTDQLTEAQTESSVAESWVSCSPGLISLPVVFAVGVRGGGTSGAQRTGREALGCSPQAAGEGRTDRVVFIPDQDIGDAKVGQRLPGLDEAQLGLRQRELGHVLVGFQDPWGEL